MRRYGAKFREIYNRETKTTRKVYNPVIYKNNGNQVLVSQGEDIMEFDNRKDALKQAEQTYNELKDMDADWIK